MVLANVFFFIKQFTTTETVKKHASASAIRTKSSYLPEKLCKFSEKHVETFIQSDSGITIGKTLVFTYFESFLKVDHRQTDKAVQLG